MKKIVFLFFLLVMGSLVFAQQEELAQVHMHVPSGLYRNELYFDIAHVFLYDFRSYNKDTDDVFSTFRSGANLLLGLRFMVLPGLEASTKYISSQNEKIIGASYSYDFADYFFKAQVGAEFFIYDDPISPEARRNLYYYASLQSYQLFQLFSLALNASFDGYNGHPGFAFGAEVQPLSWLGTTLEYFPLLFKDDANPLVGDKGIFVGGLKILTSGHQFLFFVTNGRVLGTRHYMLGTENGELHFGFNIKRYFF